MRQVPRIIFALILIFTHCAAISKTGSNDIAQLVDWISTHADDVPKPNTQKDQTASAANSHEKDDEQDEEEAGEIQSGQLTAQSLQVQFSPFNLSILFVLHLLIVQ